MGVITMTGGSYEEVEIELAGKRRVSFPGGVEVAERDGVLMLSFVVGGGEGEVCIETVVLDEPDPCDSVRVANPPRMLCVLKFDRPLQVAEVRR